MTAEKLAKHAETLKEQVEVFLAYLSFEAVGKDLVKVKVEHEEACYQVSEKPDGKTTVQLVSDKGDFGEFMAEQVPDVAFVNPSDEACFDHHGIWEWMAKIIYIGC